MIIEIRDDWRAKSDEAQWQIQVKRVTGSKAKEPGKVVWVTVGYYGSADQALKGAVEHILRNDPDTVTLDGLIEKVNGVRDIVAQRLGLAV